MPMCLTRRTVTDVSVNFMGMIIAAISVVTSGMQQIMCGTIQRKHGLTSNQLLSNTAPVQVRPYTGVAACVAPAPHASCTEARCIG